MRRFLSPLLFLAVTSALTLGCGEESPSGFPNDNTVPEEPCAEAYDAAVGKNGFKLTGGGYSKQVIKFDPASAEMVRNDIGATTIVHTIIDTVQVSSSATARVKVEITIPSQATGTHAWENVAENKGTAGVRVEITDATSTKVYKASRGSIKLDSTLSANNISGTYCGIVKDSATGTALAITSGSFSIPNDPNLPSNPCSSVPNPAVAPNGFTLRGDIYTVTHIKFEDFSRDFGVSFDPEEVAYSISDDVVLNGSNASVRLDITIPSFTVPSTHDWSELGAMVRLEIVQGSSRRVYKSFGASGKTMLTQLISGADAKGTFCGTLKDSLSNSTVAITGGVFSSSE